MKKLLLLLAFAPILTGQLSLRPADVIVPVVGSTAGQSSALFRTELQLANPTGAAIGGWFVLRPRGVFLRYDIPARGTISFADVVAEMGATGLGSLDILVDRGIVPTIVARAYDDQPAGTTGVGIPAIVVADVLGREEGGLLIVPRDLVRYRFNVGVRALSSGATMNVIVRTPAGVQRNGRIFVIPENAFFQQSANEFAGVFLAANETIEIAITAGSAIVYATTVDNVTNDGTLQVLRK